MSYLFQKAPPLQVPIVYHDENYSTLYLPNDIWDTFLPYCDLVDDKMAVTFARVTQKDVSLDVQLPSVGATFWCRPTGMATTLIPRHLTKDYPHLFQVIDSESTHARPSHWLTIARPVCLQTIVLQTLTADVPKGDVARHLSRLSEIRELLHVGKTLSFMALDTRGPLPASRRVQFKIKMTEPASSGYMDIRSTRVILLESDTPDINGAGSSDTSAVSSDGEDEAAYDIDERFLGNMVDSRTASSMQHINCRLLPLLHPKSEDDTSLYVRTVDLSNIGVLDGDWVLVKSGNKSHRLMRVFAEDGHEIDPHVVYASPITVFNFSNDTLYRHNPSVIIHATPFGSKRPAIPTARSITIARIASPVSTHRAYQPYFLQSLQEHFQTRKRLIKQADIIVLPLDTDESRSSWQSDDKPQNKILKISLDLDRPSNSVNDVVYFMVTNIEHDIMAADSSTADDILAASTMGEYGCWVDPAATRIVQAGVEHSRVPDVASYFSLTKNSSEDMTTGAEKLLALSSAALSRNAVDLELQVSILLKGSRGTGKMSAVFQVAHKLGVHVLEVNCYNLIGDNDNQTEGTLRARFEKAASCSPCFLVLRNVDALSQTTQSSEPGKENILAGAISSCIEELPQAWRLSGYPVLVLATTDSPDQTAQSLVSCFKHEILFQAPDERERASVLRSLLDGVEKAPDVSIEDLATQTAALVASDLVDLVSRGEHTHVKQAVASKSSHALAHAEVLLTADDLEVALNNARTSYSESIGAPKIPTVSWDDVGGLANVKKDILDTVQLPLEHPELFQSGLKKRSGILLYGPPGTGKTLLAKAVATSCNLNFFSVKGPELLNMYIGESEANVRRVFQRARDAKPCVIFFDELDSVAPKRGNHGDSGGVMDRIVSQILAELDGVAGGEGGADVFVVGATNRPDLLDPALLRPGRFDRMLYLGVSQTHDAQLNILQALTRKFKLHPELSLQRVSESCPFHYTGADFYALCSDALLKAMSRKAEEVETKIALLNAGPVDPVHPYPLTPQYYLAEMATPGDIDVLVSQEDFDVALRDLIPSVSQDEMEHYARVQQQFSHETINSVDGIAKDEID